MIVNICNETIRVVKLVRNPFSRAVSSYLMAIRAGYENAAMANFLNRPVDNSRGFSFKEFLDYLGSIDRRCCNIHHRLQVHPAEEAGLVCPHTIIHLEDSFKETAACEVQLGLPPSELTRFRTSGHNTSRRNWTEFWGEVPLFRHLGNKILPDTANFYSEELAAKVVQLFFEDFSRYGYSMEEIPGLNSPLIKMDPDELLQNIIRQLPTTGPVHPPENTVGFWPDGWCATFFQADFTAVEDLHHISISGCLPGDLLCDNHLQLSNGETTISMEVNNRNDFQLNLPLTVPAEKTVTIKVTAQKHRSGAEAGFNSDTRQLAFFLKEMRFS